jgi:hypothetical protein
MKKSKGIAYVDYDSPEAARKAIEQVRGIILALSLTTDILSIVERQASS